MCRRCIEPCVRRWDRDGSGTIERGEFHSAIHAIGFSAPAAELNNIFSLVDKDGSGIVSYAELHTLLRQGAGVKLDKALQDGAKGEITTESENTIKLRKSANERRGPGRAATMDELRRAIAARHTRVMDLFRALDESGDGTVTKAEFRSALPMLGFDASAAEGIDALFDALDEDGSGTISHTELHARLRQGADVELSPSLQAGALGELELEAKNPIATRA